MSTNSGVKHTKPPGARTINEILQEARSRLHRLHPQNAFERTQQTECPAILVDIRPAAQREKHGVIPGALVVERNVLEWRFDPQSDARLEIIDEERRGYDMEVIIYCQEGYTSSLAAASLKDLGLSRATDIVGGIRAWKEANLPVVLLHPPHSDTPGPSGTSLT
jgi:rhodanese-related sulfurtransferase